MSAPLRLNGAELTVEDVRAVSQGAPIEIDEDAIRRLDSVRDMLEQNIRRGEIMYGINTGFGSLASNAIPSERLEDLQLNLIRSHAVGLGPEMRHDEVRAMMVIRLNTLLVGRSGIRSCIAVRLLDHLNSDLMPSVPTHGSLGASGDLAPLAHAALPIVGEGFLVSDGVTIGTQEALDEAGWKPLRLKAKEGLALINGTAQMAGRGSLITERIRRLLEKTEIVTAAMLEAFRGSMDPFDPRVHAVRPHQGQITSATRIRSALEGSKRREGDAVIPRVQDPYSFRCAPQVHGVAWDALNRFEDVLGIEINAATDNPLLFERDGELDVISQGNFHGEVLGNAADHLALALYEVGHIMERRMDALLDPNRSGLPAFLAKDPGLESGWMIVHYAAAAALASLHGSVNPRTAFSTPTSGMQEDHVSCGATAMENLHVATTRFSELLSCASGIAAAALELDDTPSSPIIEAWRTEVRGYIPLVDQDVSRSDGLRAYAHALNWS